MLEFDLRSLLDKNDPAGVATELVGKARALAGSSNRRAVEFLVDAIGVRVSDTKNESYLADALNYLCAQLFAHSGMPAEAAAAAAASNVLPWPGGDTLFADAVAEGVALARAQDEAISRGAPAIMLACMPRAASAALTATLSEITGAPVLRISLGRFPDFALVHDWLRRFLRGGAILHDHFGASEFNLSVLRDCGVGVVHLLVRDPRAAAASLARRRHGAGATPAHLDAFYSRQYAPWLREWLAAENQRRVEVRWIRSGDVTSNPASLRTVLASILGETGPYAAAIAGAKLADANFAQGDPDAWRTLAPPDLQRKMWALLPDEIVERLQLRP